jgi:hypothetical protein
MKKLAEIGTTADAIKKQTANDVPESLQGPWYHGTGNRHLSTLDNQHGRVTWLTRSPAGGISWGPKVITAYVIDKLDVVRLTDAGAGDDGGTDPRDPTRKLPNWWLPVNTAEITKLMVVGTLDKSTMTAVSIRETMFDDFYKGLIEKLSTIPHDGKK